MWMATALICFEVDSYGTYLDYEYSFLLPAAQHQKSILSE